MIEKKRRFYVPNKDSYTTVSDLRNKDSQEVLPKEEKLTGVNDLVITLPNRTKMIVYPEPKKSF